MVWSIGLAQQIQGSGQSLHCDALVYSEIGEDNLQAVQFAPRVKTQECGLERRLERSPDTVHADAR